jgi:hypothetical protein
MMLSTEREGTALSAGNLLKRKVLSSARGISHADASVYVLCGTEIGSKETVSKGSRLP